MERVRPLNIPRICELAQKIGNLDRTESCMYAENNRIGMTYIGV